MVPLKLFPKWLHVSRNTRLVWQGLPVSLKKLFSFALFLLLHAVSRDAVFPTKIGPLY